ncbi:MAG: helix-turn-helix transcriptional regulator [Clostridia bacterium]|nr:helix-turn-helix transcriptional regulator [Clostridia bacterium]
MSALSEQIARFRRDADETQTALAEALGVSNRTVSKWENGESEPEVSYLTALADHFSTTVDALLGHAPKDPDPYAGAKGFEDLTARYSASLKEGTSRLLHAWIGLSHVERDGEPADRIPALPPDPWDEDVKKQREEQGWTSVSTAVTDSPLYTEFFTSDAVNMALALFPNRDNYGWLDSRAEELARALGLFADPRVLRLLRRMHEKDFPEKFTLAYAADLAGMKEEELEPVLSLLMGPPAPVELAEGAAKYWRYWYGSAGTLAFLSAFYSAFFTDSGARCGAFNGPFRPMIPHDGKEGTK